MKRTTWNRVLIAFIAIVSLIAFSDIFAQDQKAPAKEKAQVTAKAPVHQAGSAACLEAHKSGKCTGHDRVPVSAMGTAVEPAASTTPRRAMATAAAPSTPPRRKGDRRDGPATPTKGGGC